MAETTLTRRSFLEASATTATAITAAAWLSTSAEAASTSANETIRVGIVGPGGRGRALLNDFFSVNQAANAQLTAICDIWNENRDKANSIVKEKSGADPKVYKRVEELLGDKDIDAVIIATPDHAHAKLLIQALAAGKDVYCEKPFANVLSEANAALAAVNKSDRIVQIGTQRRADPKYIQAAELMRQGAVGDIVKVDVIWNAYSPTRWSVSPETLAAVKASDVDWQAFLLDKPERPFDARIFRSFRLFKEFSSGIIDQWMTHGVDVVHMLTGEQYPTSVSAQGGLYHSTDYRENPNVIDVTLEYGAGDKRFLATYATNLFNETGKATRVLGTRGTLEVEDVWRLSGDGSKRRDRIEQATELKGAPGVVHHMANWLNAIRSRKKDSLYCPASAGYGHSVACIMAAESYWTGRRMVFDAAAQTIKPMA